MADLINDLGGTAGFGENVFYRNDDSATGAIDITSVFGEDGLQFGDNYYTSMYINNNGMITFGTPFGGYTPNGLSAGVSGGIPSIALFWTDIDTRYGYVPVSPGGNSTGSNSVYWDIDPVADRVIITWDDVGLYSHGSQSVLAGQIILTDSGSGNVGIQFLYEYTNSGRVAAAGWNVGTTSGVEGVDYYEILGGPQSLNALDEIDSNVEIPAFWSWNLQDGVIAEAPPVFTSSQIANAIDENSGASQVVYTAVATDDGITVTYTLKEADDYILFTIDSVTGEVTLLENPDYETKQSYSFTVIATDNSDNATELAVTLTINDLSELANSAPTSSDLILETAQDETINGVLPQANDVDGDPIIYIINKYAMHGDLYIHENGHFTYNPDASFYGFDMFKFAVVDDEGAQNIYSVKIDIDPKIQTPIYQDDAMFNDIAKLYVATFNRAPDDEGLRYWAYDSGLTIEEIAQSFFDQSETKELYPEGTSNESFVVSVYDNLFNRAPDDAGLAYWVAELNSGAVAKENFILAVMNGALDTESGLDKTVLENKMNIGLAFANEGLDELKWARDVMDGVDASAYSVAQALQEIELIGVYAQTDVPTDII